MKYFLLSLCLLAAGCNGERKDLTRVERVERWEVSAQAEMCFAGQPGFRECNGVALFSETFISREEAALFAKGILGQEDFIELSIQKVYFEKLVHPEVPVEE